MGSACGVCGRTSIDQVIPTDQPPLASRLRVTAETLRTLPDRLAARQSVFASTGGLHAAGALRRRGRPPGPRRGHRAAQRDGQARRRLPAPRRAAALRFAPPRLRARGLRDRPEGVSRRDPDRGRRLRSVESRRGAGGGNGDDARRISAGRALQPLHAPRTDRLSAAEAHPPRVCISRCGSRSRAARGQERRAVASGQPLLGAAVGARRPRRIDKIRRAPRRRRRRAAARAGRAPFVA